jgi:hypothetical protein
MSPLLAPLAALGLLLVAAPAFAAENVRIKKCQDNTGKWHYGDNAAEECARSKIEVLSGEGVKKKEILAPPTEAEVADRERRREELEREKLNAEEQAKRDKILLQTYAVEDDIILVRDRKLSQLEATIKASEDTLKSLNAALARMETQKQGDTDAKALAQTEKGIAQTKGQITRHEASVAQKRKEQEQLRKQYAQDLERYRELKQKAATAPASAPAKK